MREPAGPPPESSNNPAAHDPTALPAGLPTPIDDGAAAHLAGLELPRVPLRSTSGEWVSMSDLREPAVLFFFPRTGVPGQPPARGFGGEDWDEIPGARGCTPQACGFRDLHGEFVALGVRVWGVSTSTPEHQAEFVRRMGVPYHLLSDCDLSLTRAMKLPAFRFPVESGGPDVLIRRMAWYVEPSAPAPAPRKKRHAPIPDAPPQPRIVRLWYPVFPPDRCAADVLAWLTARWGARRGAGEGAASADRG